MKINHYILYSRLFNLITISIMILIIIEIANKVDFLVKGVISQFMMMFYFSSTIRGRDLLNSDFNNLSREDKLYFLETMQDIDRYFDDSSKTYFIIVVVISLYIFYLISRFIIQRNGLTKNSQPMAAYSNNKNIVLLSKKKLNIADSFRFISRNYIFVNSIFLSEKINESQKKFIVSHEIFHGYSFDSLTKAIILSCYIFLPIFMFTHMVIPFLIQYLKPIYGEIFNYNNHIYIPFFILSIVYIYIFFKRKKFISSFFHYKEHLADLYAYLSTKNKFIFTTVNESNLYHPSSKSRTKFLNNQKSTVSIDSYYYVLCIIYLSNMSYKVFSLILLSLLAIVFIFIVKHLYISLLPVIICSLMLFFSKVGWLYMLNSDIVGDKYSILQTIDFLFLITLYLSYFISLLNKREC